MQATEDSHSIQELLSVVQKLPPETPQASKLPMGEGYKTFRAQWIAWLRDYGGPGYYGRKDGKRSARWVYQHLCNGGMIVWLSEAAGENPKTIEAAIEDMQRNGPSAQGRAKIARSHLPWVRAARLLFA